MLRVERLAVVAEGNPGLAAGHVIEREVRGVAAVAEGEHVLGLGLDVLEQRVHGDALPDGVELRPRRHAVDVLRNGLARQPLELLPGPRQPLVAARDRERPVLERRMRGRPG